jgi:hypothetical protein
MAPHSPAAALVRSVADDRLAHGDLTFGIGFLVIIGGGTLTMLGAIALRLAGAL